MAARRWMWTALGVVFGVGVMLWIARRRRAEDEAIEIPVRFEPAAPPLAA